MAKKIKLVGGIGYNDKTRPAGIQGKVTEEYNLWTAIIWRLNSYKKNGYNASYKNCTMSENFKSYSYFYDWCNRQVGFKNKGWQLDKDILGKGAKLYSEDTCCFVPKEINYFFIDRLYKRGEYPIGVSYHKLNYKFTAHCSVKGRRKHLGYYHTSEEAHNAYKVFKEAQCKLLAEKYKSELSEKVYKALLNWEVTDELCR